MRPTTQDLSVVEFGPFQADVRSGELRKFGVKLKLHAQPFQVLAMLLEQPGELISREEIRQRLWPEDTFVDFDHGLNNAVNRLREALGDSAATPRFIETVPRRGYRFIAALNVDKTTPRTSESAEKAEGREWWRSLWVIGSLPGSLALLFVVFIFWRSPAQPSSRSFVLPPQDTTFNLIRDYSGPVTLSADGTKLAFAATNARGTSRIWVRSLSNLNAQALEGTEGGTFPFWSPDGQWIAFFSDSERKLKKIALKGGPAVALCDAPFGRGGSWSPLGVIVFAPAYVAGLYKVPASGGTPAEVTTLDRAAHTSHRWPHFLPDGRHFIYLAVNHRHDFSHDGIYLGSIDGKENERIVASHANAAYASGYLFYLSDDVLMAQHFEPKRARLWGEARATVEKVVYDPAIWKAVFDVSEQGVMAYQLGGNVKESEMQWFDRSGKMLGALGEAGFHAGPKLSPNGGKLLVSQAKFGNYGDLWVYDLERKLSTRVTFEDGDTGGIWSHDGRQVIFTVKDPESHVAIYETDDRGEGQKRLLFDPGVDIILNDISRDGRFLLYGQPGKSGAKEMLWVAPTEHGRKPFPVGGRGSQKYGQFSPDGRWVAYTSQDSGREEVYVVPFHPPVGTMAGESADSRWQISTSGGRCPRWRGDGKELFFIAGDNTLMSVLIDKNFSRLTTSLPKPLFRAGLLNTVVDITAIYDVSQDGKKFIFSFGVLPASKAPITLVQNWLSDLK